MSFLAIYFLIPQITWSPHLQDLLVLGNVTDVAQK